MKLPPLTARVLASVALGMATASLFGNQAAANPNLLMNGSFENTAGFSDDHPGDDTTSLGVGSTAMTGWTVAGGEPLAWIGPSNPFSLSASQGSYFLDLTGYSAGGPPFSGVSQTISTSAGSVYQLSFDLGSSSPYGIQDGITVNAPSSSATFTSTNGAETDKWETETLNFTATGGLSTISLIGASGANYIGLDNVSVTLVSGPVPEPATLALLGAGLASLGLVRRKRAQ